MRYTVQFVRKTNRDIPPYQTNMRLTAVKGLVKFINSNPHMYEIGCDNIIVTRQAEGSRCPK